MEISEAKRLKAIEEENRRLKTLVADLTLDNSALKELPTKKFQSPRGDGPRAPG
jgi:putative transposase